MKRMQALVLAAIAASCRQAGDTTLTLPPDEAQVQIRESDPPVALNADSPVEYPMALYQQRISATVLLRLYADETGKVIPDSTRVQESSGYPALDSAAMAAVPQLRYAPGLRNGLPVATAFTQPIRFRHPDRSGVTP